MTTPLNASYGHALIFQSQNPTNYARLILLAGPALNTTEGKLPKGMNMVMITSETNARISVVAKRSGVDTILGELPAASPTAPKFATFRVPNEDTNATIRCQQVAPGSDVVGQRVGMMISTLPTDVT